MGLSGKWVSFKTLVRRVWVLSLPYFKSEQKWVARGLLANLGLMFVPVSAGILYQLRSLGAAAWDVVWVVVVATVVTLVATAATFTVLSRRVEDDAS